MDVGHSYVLLLFLLLYPLFLLTGATPPTLDRVLRQIASSYDQQCFVYLHRVSDCHLGVGRLSNGNATAGIAVSNGSLASHQEISGLTRDVECVVFVMPPHDQDEMLAVEEILWHVLCPIKVAVFIADLDSAKRLKIRTVNSTFVHLAIPAKCSSRDGTSLNGFPQDSSSIFCLSLYPARLMHGFEQCRDLTENPRGKTLSVAYAGGLPNVDYNDPPGGADFVTLKLIQSKLGFDYVPHKMDLFDSDTGKALIQEVASGRADVGFGGAYATWKRNQLLTFLFPLSVQPVKLITPAPKPKATLDTIFLPFDLATWMLVLVSCLTLILALDLMDVVDRSVFIGRKISAGSYFRNFSFVYGSLLNLELPFWWFAQVDSRARRVLIGVTVLAGVFLNMAYKSTLRANLFTISYEKPLDSAEEILASGLPVLVYTYSLQSSLLRDSDRLVLRRIFNESVVAKNGFFDDYDDELWRKQASGKYVFVATPTDQYFTYGKFHVPQDTVIQTIIPFMVPKCSVLPRTFNEYFIRLVGGGIVQKITMSFAVNNNPYDSSRAYVIKTSDDPLVLEQLSPIFFILIGGTVIAACCFLCELLVKRLFRADNDFVNVSILDDDLHKQARRTI